MLKESDQHEVVQVLLRDLRVSAGFRQSDVAARLKVPQSFVSKYEVGERRLNVIELRGLCKLFGISLPQFAAMLESKLQELVS